MNQPPLPTFNYGRDTFKVVQRQRRNNNPHTIHGDYCSLQHLTRTGETGKAFFHLDQASAAKSWCTRLTLERSTNPYADAMIEAAQRAGIMVYVVYI
jgi:hypothetical protein